jgi:hypothetical protein
MNTRRHNPVGIIHVAQVKDKVGLIPLQVACVPVVKTVAKVVESRIRKPIKRDESYEVRENIGNSEKKVIIYKIGEEEEKEDVKHEEEYIPVPVLEEPVIETLSVGVVPFSSSPIIEDEGGTVEDVKQLHEVKKKKRRMKGVRK